jgi:Tfp pilus assembly protein PilX
MAAEVQAKIKPGLSPVEILIRELHRKNMKRKMKNNGSVLLVVIFVIALLTAFTVGMLQLHSEQFQIMKNEIFTAQSNLIAQAGIADALARLRTNQALPTNFNASFGGGSYSVTVAGSLPDPNFTAVGTSAQGFTTNISADVTVDTSSYVVRIDKLRINE